MHENFTKYDKTVRILELCFEILVEIFVYLAALTKCCLKKQFLKMLRYFLVKIFQCLMKFNLFLLHLKRYFTFNNSFAKTLKRVATMPKYCIYIISNKNECLVKRLHVFT